MRPSPFPGVDPYLEASPLWQGFHNSYIHGLLEAIQPALPDKYVAVMEMRIYLQPTEEGGRTRSRIPDLQVARTGPQQVSSVHASAARGVMLDLDMDLLESREALLNIFEASTRRLVTSVELLSPSNKRPGAGREEYRNKQLRLYGEGVNLVEIDFIRGGMNALLVPGERLSSLGPFDFVTGKLRAAEYLRYEARTWTLRESIPMLTVPLDAEEPEVPVELQAVYQRTFANSAFTRLLNYTRGLVPPLEFEDQDWADQLLAAADLKRSSGLEGSLPHF